ncbi:MAG TPA: aminoglycoside phosphotransferase family protein [Acidimicrobiales bacterium]|nr:aminoglycoside phosphotransferase family protein [Acidimicrobiales bacterium]
MGWPPAEVRIDAALVSSLLHAQFPDLANLNCYKVDEGFDNSLWRLGEELVVRIPRREIAAALIENELRWLPEIARHVSLATPLPLRAGVATDDFPWPWLIASWHNGEAGDEIDPKVRGRSAKEMAIFLRELHSEAPTDAPFNPFRSVSLVDRETSLYSRLYDLGDDVDFEFVEALWKRVRDTPRWDDPGHWLHGDFHPGNTLYRNGALVGVVDFGDVCAGDPAVDLAGGLLSLPYESLQEFFDAYEGCDEAMLRRTIGWAVLFGVMFLSLGRTRTSYLSIGQLALANAKALATTL